MPPHFFEQWNTNGVSDHRARVAPSERVLSFLGPPPAAVYLGTQLTE